MTCNVDQLASRLNGDWRTLVRARLHVLVTGPNRALEEFVELCRGEVRQPIAFASPSGPLPPHSATTLVITDVHLFDDAAQQALTAWVRHPAHASAQVVSLTSTPLFALVDAGRFDPELYYCLNMVRLQLNEATTVPISHPRVA
jgi:hypothetical protein